MRNIFVLLSITILFAQNEVCFEIEDNPNQNQPGFGYFTKYVNVLDCFSIYYFCIFTNCFYNIKIIPTT